MKIGVFPCSLHCFFQQVCVWVIFTHITLVIEALKVMKNEGIVKKRIVLPSTRSWDILAFSVKEQCPCIRKIMSPNH